jgi:hypothetical protein
MIRAAQELKDNGTYGFAKRAISDADAASQMRSLPRAPL